MKTTIYIAKAYAKALIVLALMFGLWYLFNVEPATAQGFSISVRDPNSSEISEIDFEIKLTALNYKNKYILSFLFERENGIEYREIIAQAEVGDWYGKYYERTARAIKNADLGYFRQAGWFRMGGSVHRDISGDVSLLADIGVQSRYITAKFQRGIRTWIADGEFKWNKLISKELFTVRGLKFVPGYEVLFKYYVDGQGRIFRQFKVSVNIGTVT